MDAIENFKDNTTVGGSSSKDTITNSGNSVFIDSGTGNDSVSNSGNDVTLLGGSGNDSIHNYGNKTVIDGGAGADKIYIKENSTGNTISGGAGNDTVYTNGKGNLIRYSVGEGKDVIDGFGEKDSIEIVGETSIRTSVDSGNNKIFYVGSGTTNAITVKNGKTLSFVVKDNIIYVDGVVPLEYPATLTTAADEETFSDEGAIVDAGSGNDTITNEGAKSSIYGNAGNDLLVNTADKVTLNGGAGADKISLAGSAKDNKIIGGAGNDIIYTNGKGNLIQYAVGDGKDSIIGFNGDDSIEITDGEIGTPIQSGSNILVTIGSGTANVINIKDTKISDIKVNGNFITFESHIFPATLTTAADNETYTEEGATVDAGKGNDTITNGGINSSIYGNLGNDVLVNTAKNVTLNGGAGNDTLTNKGSEVLLLGEAGSDKIYLEEGSKGVTVNGGAGADYIYTNNNGNLIQYATGDGKDTIEGLGENDSIQITSGSIRAAVDSGVNKIFYIGTGTANAITIKDGAKTVTKDGKELYLTFEDNYIVFKEDDRTHFVYDDSANFIQHNVSESTIEAMSGNDTIESFGNISSILAGAGNDSVYNHGNSSTVDGGDGIDFIRNEADEVYIIGGAGNDSITSKGNKITINAGAGADKITLDSSSENVVIEYASGGGKDSIYGFNESAEIKITSGTVRTSTVSGTNKIFYIGTGTASAITIIDGADKEFEVKDDIIRIKPRITINGSAKAENIESAKDYATINALAGNDKITNTGSEVSISGGVGNDTITSGGNKVTINGGAGADKISLDSSSENVVIEYASGDGKDSIYGFNDGDEVRIISDTISGSEDIGNDKIFYIGSGTTNAITFIDGADVIFEVEDNVIRIQPPITINGLTRADTIENEKSRATINALAGNDKITNTGSKVSISGGVGNDTITNGGNQVTINGGAGTDLISLDSSSGNVVIEYAAGDGNDTIYGLKTTDSIIITSGSIKGAAVESEGNKIFYIGDETLTIVDAADSDFETENNVIRMLQKPVIAGSSKAESISNTRNGATIDALAGNDTITSSGNKVSISGGAGNDTIESEGNNSYISGGAGNDSITSKGDNVTINAGAGADLISLDSSSKNTVIEYAGGDGKNTITGFNDSTEIKVTSGEIRTSVNGNDGTTTFYIGIGTANAITIVDGANMKLEVENTVIKVHRDIIINGTTKAEAITNDKGGATINALAGNDTITSSGDAVSINGGAGADVITSNGDDITIVGDAGNDKITSEGNKAYIEGGAGVDIITTKGNEVTINAGAGADKISLDGASENVVIEYASGGGKDSIYGFNDSAEIKITSGTIRTSTISGANKIFYVGTGTASAITIIDGADTEFETEDNIIRVKKKPEPIVLTAGADTYENEKASAIISALAGNDIITNTAKEVSISGGEGNDTITSSGNEVTINGGAGNDLINLNGDSSNVIIEYATGDGVDTISGFNATDSILVDGNVIDSVIGEDGSRIFHIGDDKNSITISNGAKLKFAVDNNIIHVKPPETISGSSKAETLNNDEDDSVINALGGNDKITNSGNAVSISGGAGNDTITNTGSEVSISGDAGADSIVDDGENVYIASGIGNDKVTLESNAKNVTIVGGTGNDSIYTNGNSNLIQYATGDGKDVIFGFADKDSIEISGTITDSVDSNGNVLVSVGSGVITIRETEIEALEVVDNVIRFKVEPEPVIIMGTDVAEKLSNADNAQGAIIYGLKGKDTITNGGIEVTIDGGADNDKISLESSAAYNSIFGGAGADTIYTNGNNNIIYYETGSGKDVILGFGGSDIVEANCQSLSPKQSGANTIFYFDGTTTSAITFKNIKPSDITYAYNEDKELYEIFIDSNIESTSSASIAEVSAVSSVNYTVGNIEKQDFNNLTQSDSIGAAYSYSTEK